MKKLIAIMILTALVAGPAVTVMTAKSDEKVRYGEVAGLVREYRQKDGFEVVSAGGFILGLLKMVAKASAETREDREVLEIMDHLDRVVVVEYYGASQSDRDSFQRKASGILKDAEKIIEVKEEGETLNVYGTTGRKGDHIEDIVIFIPEDCTMICLFGSISTDKIAELLEMTNE